LNKKHYNNLNYLFLLLKQGPTIFVTPASWFSTTVEALEATFFCPAGGKVEIPKVSGGKVEIPKSAGWYSGNPQK